MTSDERMESSLLACFPIVTCHSSLVYCTVRLNAALCTNDPEVPVTPMAYVPAGVPVGALGLPLTQELHTRVNSRIAANGTASTQARASVGEFPTGA